MMAVTVHMYNPFVDEMDIRLFLQRYCSVVGKGEKVCNTFGIWTGRRKYMVRLQAAEPRLPATFAIGPNRGLLYYPGQLETCRRCGKNWAYEDSLQRGHVSLLWIKGAQDSGVQSPEEVQPLWF